MHNIIDNDKVEIEYEGETFIISEVQLHTELFGKRTGVLQLEDIRLAIPEEFEHASVKEQVNHAYSARKYKCDQCGKEFWSIAQSLNVEDRVETECQICGVSVYPDTQDQAE